MDLDLIEKFFRYAADSTTATADSLESDFVRQIHERVLSVKNNRELEVEFVKLLERDQKNFQEGRAEGKAEGIVQGTVRTLAGLVRDGIISLDEAARRADMSPADFEAAAEKLS